jgi:hypothetical protein
MPDSKANFVRQRRGDVARAVRRRGGCQGEKKEVFRNS